MTIQMKAIDQYFSGCGTVYYALQGVSNFFASVGEILKCDCIQMKAIDGYFPIVLFIFLYKVVLNFRVCG